MNGILAGVSSSVRHFQCFFTGYSVSFMVTGACDFEVFLFASRTAADGGGLGLNVNVFASSPSRIPVGSSRAFSLEMSVLNPVNAFPGSWIGVKTECRGTAGVSAGICCSLSAVSLADTVFSASGAAGLSAEAFFEVSGLRRSDSLNSGFKET